MDILRAALELETELPHALITVVGSSGSTPRHVGTRMLVSAQGKGVFTIGGGRVEKELVEAGQRVAQGAPAHLVKHHLVQDLAMCCGGSMEFYVEPVAPSVDTLRRAVQLHEHRQSFVLVTPLDGGKKWIDLSVAGGERRPARRAESFAEPVWPRPRLLLFGCGHVARALGPLARQVCFEVIVCDDNETGAIDDVPSWATRVVPSFEIGDVQRVLGELGAGDYLLILTRDHAIDQRILESSLPLVAKVDYLGLIGSLGKIGRFRKRIFAKGVTSEEEWARMHAPIGLDIAAETPAEIAVSIVAELIAMRNKRRE